MTRVEAEVKQAKDGEAEHIASERQEKEKS
jgi:hypothetical protein